jgi:hypothetical protein
LSEPDVAVVQVPDAVSDFFESDVLPFEQVRGTTDTTAQQAGCGIEKRAPGWWLEILRWLS